MGRSAPTDGSITFTSLNPISNLPFSFASLSTTVQKKVPYQILLSIVRSLTIKTQGTEVATITRAHSPLFLAYPLFFEMKYLHTKKTDAIFKINNSLGKIIPINYLNQNNFKLIKLLFRKLICHFYYRAVETYPEIFFGNETQNLEIFTKIRIF